MVILFSQVLYPKLLMRIIPSFRVVSCIVLCRLNCKIINRDPSGSVVFEHLQCEYKKSQINLSIFSIMSAQNFNL